VTGARLAAVILAAGASQRMGRVKALLPLDGETFLDRLLLLFATHCDPLVVVLGYHAEEIAFQSRRSPDAVLIMNPRPEQGQFSSLQRSIAALPGDVEGVFFCPVDTPAWQRSTLDALTGRFASRGSGELIFRPRHKDQRGHPVLLERSLIPELKAAPPTEQARHILSRHPQQTVFVDVDDPGILIDIDEPAHFEAFQRDV
jgi:CTP:molybdopterin cytidylyltransferase MocA